MTLRKEKLAKIKAQIVSRRDTLAQGLQGATAALIAEDEMYSDSVDQASAETDKVLADQIRRHEQDVLAELNEALRRMEDGSFGECSNCGEDIADARLMANPSTTLCIDCKAEIESEEGRYTAR